MIESGSQFCTNCEKTVNQMSNPIQSSQMGVGAGITLDDAQRISLDSVPQVRPWVRFFARLFDIQLSFFITLPLLAVLVILVPGFDMLLNAVSESDIVDRIFTLMIELLVLAFVEPHWISRYGFTPGKWLFKIKVISATGRHLTLSQAFARSLKVYVKGYSLGIPFLSLITLLLEGQRLHTKGNTSWDQEGEFKVLHENIGTMRWLIIIGAFFILYSIIMLISNIITTV
jgi:uncharacterized RDD family membrane protein YckC